MRVVIALGGNAILKRGEVMSAENQRQNVRRAALAIGLIEPIFQTVAFAVHERVWERIGRKAGPTDAGPRPATA